MTDKQKILKYIDYKGISKNQFYIKTGLSVGFLDKGNSLGVDKLKTIIDNYHDLNINWFFDDNSPMLKEQPLSLQQSIVSQPYEEVKRMPLIASEPIGEYNAQNVVTMPIIDVAGAAGFGTFNSDNPEQLGELVLPASMVKKRYGNYYCGKVYGESMAPTLQDGDFVAFRLLNTNEWEDIKDDSICFVVCRSGDSYIKRIQNNLRQSGVIVCQSDNTEGRFRDFSLDCNDIANLYLVEWHFSNNLNNINSYYDDRFNRLENSFNNQFKEIKNLLKQK